MLEKKYDHKLTEKNKYDKWKEKGYDTLWLPGMDPVAMTALSNEEVIYSEEKGAFYHIKYKLENSDEYLDIATTRPETLFGDTAVAVNPEDTRYQKYIGKNVVLPIVNKLIPVIADEHADMEKGTGCVNVIPFGTNKLKILKNKGFKKLITFNNINNEEEKIAC